jgi:hypothetical protein
LQSCAGAENLWTESEVKGMNRRQRMKAQKNKPTPPKIERMPENLGNYGSCLHPPQFIDEKDCPGCQHYTVCVYRNKEQYKRVKV